MANDAAILQFEFDKRRLATATRKSSYGRTAHIDAHDVVRNALEDVLENCGTLVLVVSDAKLTVVQRPKGSDAHP